MDLLVVALMLALMWLPVYVGMVSVIIVAAQYEAWQLRKKKRNDAQEETTE